jgi:hypothetical protein
MNLDEMSLSTTDDTEILFLRIRNWRTRELLATDWTQLADSTADKAAWATYRQALRDLPASNKDPKKIIFPTRPA